MTSETSGTLVVAAFPPLALLSRCSTLALPNWCRALALVQRHCTPDPIERRRDVEGIGVMVGMDFGTVQKTTIHIARIAEWRCPYSFRRQFH
jgi:hypothetical protein